MDESKKITRNLSFIKKSIVDIDDVIDLLIEQEILGMAERNIILSEDDPVHSILETVLKKQAYTKFTKVLESTGNSLIVKRFENTVISREDETQCVENNQEDVYTEEKYKRDKTFVIEKDLEILKTENNDLKLKQAQIRQQLNSEQQKLLQLKKEACSYQKQNLELNQRLSSLRRSDTLNTIIDKKEKQLEEKEERNEQKKRDIERKSDAIATLRLELEDLNKEMSEKTDQIDMLTRELKYLREEHHSARGERKELKLKIEDLNSNLEEKMQNMFNIISENKVHAARSPRQTTSFSRLTAQSRKSNNAQGSRENSSVLPTLSDRKSSPSRTDDSKSNTSKESPRSRIKRPQQFISPQYISATYNSTHRSTAKPKNLWK